MYCNLRRATREGFLRLAHLAAPVLAEQSPYTTPQFGGCGPCTSHTSHQPHRTGARRTASRPHPRPAIAQFCPTGISL
ncbi:hypothetical protein EDB80DRAFT_715864 [Ilyonectria destructans]|nr:hypothetical protein EDB80DRAFT_715864 [Ilyonectria destructans]